MKAVVGLRQKGLPLVKNRVILIIHPGNICVCSNCHYWLSDRGEYWCLQQRARCGCCRRLTQEPRWTLTTSHNGAQPWEGQLPKGLTKPGVTPKDGRLQAQSPCSLEIRWKNWWQCTQVKETIRGKDASGGLNLSLGVCERPPSSSENWIPTGRGRHSQHSKLRWHIHLCLKHIYLQKARTDLRETVFFPWLEEATSQSISSKPESLCLPPDSWHFEVHLDWSHHARCGEPHFLVQLVKEWFSYFLNVRKKWKNVRKNCMKFKFQYS